MSMQIYINVNLLVFHLLLNGLLHSPNCGLFYRARIYIISIQILSERVQAVIASIHTVRVQHWHNFEHKVVAENFGLFTSLISQKVPNSVQYMRSGGLARMNSRRKKDRWLVELERS